MPVPRPLPPGSRLLHVGPPKTGSTALQEALHQSREALAEQGVHYVSRVRHEVVPARWVTGQLPTTPKWAWAEQRWRELVDAMRAEGADRKVYSSEYLADATDEQVVRVIDALGPEDTFVVITLRPLVDIVPSQYQQDLQGGLTTDYATWLRETFEGVEAPLGFWQRHRHDALVERWARVAGRDRVVVVASDGRDFDAVPAAFEKLLGLVPGTLVGRRGRPNRSLTWPEAEVMRRFNVEAGRAGLVGSKYHLLTKYAADLVKERAPAPDEPRIVTPAWAVEQARALGAAFADAIRASAVTVVGDLAALASGADVAEPSRPPASVDLDVAALFAAGFVQAERRVQEEAAERRARRATGDAPAPAEEGPSRRSRGRDRRTA